MATIYQQARKGETFTNRYAAAFLGMVREKYFKIKIRGKDKSNDKAFNEAVGDPDAAANLTKYMIDLSTNRNDDETGFFIQCAKYFPELERTYETPIVLGDWVAMNGMDGFTQTQAGHFVGNIVADDPMIYSQDNLNVDLSRYKKIKLTFQNRTNAKFGKIYFVTNEDSGIGEDKALPYAVTPRDHGFTEYLIDASGHPKWTGTLKQLRIDIVDDGSKGKFDIERVILSDIGSPKK